MIEVLSIFFTLQFASITPGPNNMVIFKISVGHSTGFVVLMGGAIILGTFLQVISISFITQYFQSVNKGTLEWLIYLSVFLMGYLGIKSLKKSLWERETKHYAELAEKKTDIVESPIGLVFFQLINPKSWILCIATYSYLVQHFSWSASIMIQFVLVCISSAISTALWASLSKSLSTFFNKNALVRWMDFILGITFISLSVDLYLDDSFQTDANLPITSYFPLSTQAGELAYEAT